MTKTYRPWEPDQVLLMPPVLREWLPKGHLVYFILDTVKCLDMPNSDEAFIQGYNAQAVVDSTCQVIVAKDVTQQTNDKMQAEPMMAQVPVNTGRTPKKASLD